jgi:hypothetical protein
LHEHRKRALVAAAGQTPFWYSPGDLTETYGLVTEPFTVEVCDGTVATRPGAASSPAIRLDTDADIFVGLMTGRVSPADSLADGARAVRRRVRLPGDLVARQARSPFRL